MNYLTFLKLNVSLESLQNPLIVKRHLRLTVSRVHGLFNQDRDWSGEETKLRLKSPTNLRKTAKF